jgi:hypothetical protein
LRDAERNSRVSPLIAEPLERGRRDAAGVRVEGVRGEAAERAVAPRVMGDEGVGEADGGGRLVVVFGELVAMSGGIVSRLYIPWLFLWVFCRVIWR